MLKVERPPPTHTKVKTFQVLEGLPFQHWVQDNYCSSSIPVPHVKCQMNTAVMWSPDTVNAEHCGM